MCCIVFLFLCTHEDHLSTMDPALHLNKARGHLNWRMGLPALLGGNLGHACQIYFVECVSKIKHIIPVIHNTICGAVCFQFTHFSCDDWDKIYALSYHRHLIGSMNYNPLFRVRSWNNGIHCMTFYILTYGSSWHFICIICDDIVYAIIKNVMHMFLR